MTLHNVPVYDMNLCIFLMSIVLMRCHQTQCFEVSKKRCKIILGLKKPSEKNRSISVKHLGVLKIAEVCMSQNSNANTNCYKTVVGFSTKLQVNLSLLCNSQHGVSYCLVEIVNTCPVLISYNNRFLKLDSVV